MADKPVPPDTSSEIPRSIGDVPKALTFSLEKSVTRDAIQALLEKVYTMAGCRNCGLLGYDVRLQVVNPAIRTDFKGIDGVVDVTTAASLRG